MSTDAASSAAVLSAGEQVRYAREILRAEGAALVTLADRLTDEFSRAIKLLFQCRGSVIVTGVGKAGLIGQKIAATLASTGTRSHFVHAADAVHGDLGRIHAHDVVLVLSNSGETDEVIRLLPTLREFGTPVVAITGNPASQLAHNATVTISLGALPEVGALGLAPTTSTTAMLALGDALALVLCRQRRFGAEDFARFHPGGNLGRKLAKVDDVLRRLDECRVADEAATVRDVFVHVSRPGRRTGAIMLTNSRGVLTGIFTDSDLARLLEHNRDAAIDGPIRDVMTHAPQTVRAGSLASEAVSILAGRKLSELPVIDEQGRPIGLIDITDVVALLPRDPAAEPVVAMSARTNGAVNGAKAVATNATLDAPDELDAHHARIVPFPQKRPGNRHS